MSSEHFSELIEVMKRAVGTLRDADVPFLLAGGIACWARGAAETDHDVDFLVKPADAERALGSLASAGMRADRPPEGWLYKAWEGDNFVDLIFQTSEGPVTDGHFERAEELEVYSVRMQVASLEDILVTKLLALNEMDLDYGSVVELSRSLREQIDWREVRKRTDESPYARAFFTLVSELGVAPDA